jgi:predicted DNA-binding transcriptional regulator YafY
VYRWFRDPEDARLLPAIADAVWHEKLLAVRYQRISEIVSRVLEPLGLVLKGGVWYLVARATEQMRTYRVSKFVELAVMDTHFARLNDFDLAHFWITASHAYEAGLYRGTATLRVSPLGMRRLSLLGTAVARAGAESAGPPDAQGRVTVVIPTESIAQAAADIMRLGTEVEVLGPAELRRHIAELARSLSRLYGDAAVGDSCY